MINSFLRNITDKQYPIEIALKIKNEVENDHTYCNESDRLTEQGIGGSAPTYGLSNQTNFSQPLYCDTCIVGPKFFLIWILLRHFLRTDPHALNDILPSNLS